MNADLYEVFREIADTNHHRHGSFLCAFADAIVKADGQNRELLAPVAARLAEKYHLVEGVQP